LILKQIPYDFLDELKTIHATINNIRCPAILKPQWLLRHPSIQETGKGFCKRRKHKP
jgi:hypothetical protein